MPHVIPTLEQFCIYLNKLDWSPFNQAYMLISVLAKQVGFVSICPIISIFLFSDTYSLRSQLNCMALKSTTSTKSQNTKEKNLC